MLPPLNPQNLPNEIKNMRDIYRLIFEIMYGRKGRSRYYRPDLQDSKSQSFLTLLNQIVTLRNQDEFSFFRKCIEICLNKQSGIFRNTGFQLSRTENTASSEMLLSLLRTPKFIELCRRLSITDLSFTKLIQLAMHTAVFGCHRYGWSENQLLERIGDRFAGVDAAKRYHSIHSRDGFFHIDMFDKKADLIENVMNLYKDRYQYLHNRFDCIFTEFLDTWINPLDEFALSIHTLLRNKGYILMQGGIEHNHHLLENLSKLGDRYEIIGIKKSLPSIGWVLIRKNEPSIDLLNINTQELIQKSGILN